METREEIISLVEKEIGQVIENMGYELVDVEYGKERGIWVLRLFVDRIEGGITLKECESISHTVSLLLDELDPIPHSYNLEVFSPGLDRILKKPKDFERFVGHKALFKLKNPIKGSRNIKATIREVVSSAVIVEREREIFSIPFENIAKARLEVEL
ncbi:MAG: ribosome maturation factor RimP [bacterium]|nr:ribosome maturation factor RimP [bacterium]